MSSVTVRSVCSRPSTVIVTPASGTFTETFVLPPGASSDANTRPETAVPATVVRLSVSKSITYEPPAMPSPLRSISMYLMWTPSM